MDDHLNVMHRVDSSMDLELQEKGVKEPLKEHSNDVTPVADNTRKVLRGPLAPINNFLNLLEWKTKDFIKSQSTFVKTTIGVILFILYTVYFSFAISIDAERATDLIYVTAFAVFCCIYWLVKKFFGHQIWNGILKPVSMAIEPRRKHIKWGISLLFLAFLIFWISWDTAKEPQRLISLAGLAIYILIGFLFSKKRDQFMSEPSLVGMFKKKGFAKLETETIKWRPVISGFALQFIFGILILRTTFGYQFFKWLGDRVSIFLGFSKPGAELIFGKSNIFAFSVLPVVVYFSAFTYLLYYLGWMQVIIHKLAWLLQVTMGTTCAESVNSAGNIFLGQTEAPLLIRPFLSKMTKSELHAVLTGGLATIAGSLLAVYINFGIPASHLLSASVMSAPAALAMSKLMYPETEETETSNEVEIEKTDETNIFEALTVGAVMSISLVANISVMMMAFVSIISLFNAILGWFGSMVNLHELSFEFICSYVFMPFAYVMGVDFKDSFIVAELLGVKTFLTEFFSYQRLGVMIRNRLYDREGTKLSIRSEVISTYALCGFANFGSMGVILGCLSAMAPNQRSTLSKLVFRALIAGTLACFMTACVAGMLYGESRYDASISAIFKNTTVTNSNSTNTI